MTNQIGIYDFETGENVVRDMTPEELSDQELRTQSAINEAKEKAAKEAQRNAVLAKIGLTEQEANLLLGIAEEELKPALG